MNSSRLMNRVIIVDVKGLIPRGGIDVLMRHEKYAVALKKIVPSSDLTVISLGPKVEKNSILEFNLFTFRNIVGLVKCGRELIKEDATNTVLVCGDPWESFYVAKIMCLFALRRVPIQIQLHADVGSALWRSLRWRNRLRFMLIRWSVRQATQVRFVSSQQMRVFEKTFGAIDVESVVIPVPIYIEPDIERNKKADSRNVIAFVGRLEIDRGLNKFLQLVSTIEKSHLFAEYWIIGTGSQEEWLRSEVARMGIVNKVTFFGEVFQSDLSVLWPKIGCLISVAPSESYGRAVREALAHGVPVLAQRSSGLLELEEEFNGNGLMFLEDDDAKTIVSLVDSAFDTVVPEFLSKKIADSADAAPNLLAMSWMKLLCGD